MRGISGTVRSLRFLPTSGGRRRPAVVDVLAAQPGQLGDPQPGLDRGQQQRVVAAAGPDVTVGRGEQRVDLLVGEVGDERAVESFGGEREHPLDHRGIFGVLERRVAKQRPDRGEANVAGARAVAAFLFEVIEERAISPRRGQRVELGWLAGPLGRT